MLTMASINMTEASINILKPDKMEFHISPSVYLLHLKTLYSKNICSTYPSILLTSLTGKQANQFIIQNGEGPFN